MDNPTRSHQGPVGLHAVEARAYHLVAWLDGEIPRIETQRVLFTLNHGFDTTRLAYCPSSRSLRPTVSLVPPGGVAEILTDPSPEELAAAKDRLLGHLVVHDSTSR